MEITSDFEERVRRYIRRVESDPKFSVQSNRVRTEALKNHYGRAKARNFEFFSDEPENGGENRGPRPLEYFLAGFAFCQQVQYASYAALRGIDVTDLKIDVNGLVDQRGIFEIGDVKPGFKKIKYTVKIETSEDVDTIMNLVKKAEQICPAHATLREPIQPIRDVVINGEKIRP